MYCTLTRLAHLLVPIFYSCTAWFLSFQFCRNMSEMCVKIDNVGLQVQDESGRIERMRWNFHEILSCLISFYIHFIAVKTYIDHPRRGCVWAQWMFWLDCDCKYCTKEILLLMFQCSSSTLHSAMNVSTNLSGRSFHSTHSFPREQDWSSLSKSILERKIQELSASPTRVQHTFFCLLKCKFPVLGGSFHQWKWERYFSLLCLC